MAQGGTRITRVTRGTRGTGGTKDTRGTRGTRDTRGTGGTIGTPAQVFPPKCAHLFFLRPRYVPEHLYVIVRTVEKTSQSIQGRFF